MTKDEAQAEAVELLRAVVEHTWHAGWSARARAVLRELER